MQLRPLTIRGMVLGAGRSAEFGFYVVWGDKYPPGFWVQIGPFYICGRRPPPPQPAQPPPPEPLPIRAEAVNKLVGLGREYVETVLARRQHRLSQFLLTNAPDPLTRREDLLVREAERALRVLEQSQHV